MKFLIIAFTTVLSLLGSTSRASDDPSTIIMESFNYSFQSASEVKWSAVSGLHKAEFTYNSRVIAAYFDAEGLLVATTRNMSSLDLPQALQKSLKKEAGAAWINELFEVSDESGTSYYVTLENADTKTVLKSTGGAWTSFRKIAK